jgi:hypothetical protein
MQSGNQAEKDAFADDPESIPAPPKDDRRLDPDQQLE